MGIGRQKRRGGGREVDRQQKPADGGGRRGGRAGWVRTRGQRGGPAGGRTSPPAHAERRRDARGEIPGAQPGAYGAGIFTKTPVGGLEPLAGGGYLVHPPRGAIRTRRVINATGAWSPMLAKLIGVDVPTWPIRHEICSSEPLKPFLRPMVS